MAILPTSLNSNKPTHTVSVALFIENKDLSYLPGGIQSLSIYKEFNKIPSAKITITDGKVEKGSFEKSDSESFIPGKSADIRLGYQNETETIFKGIIVKHGLKAISQSGSSLEIECKDVAVKMTLIRRSKYFMEMKDSDVFREILDGYSGKGITTGSLASTNFKHPELVQYNCTDWDFLIMRAEANGLVVCIDNGTVNILKPEVASIAQCNIDWGGNIIDFEAEMDSRTHYSNVETATWDNSKQEIAKENGDGSSGGGLNAIRSLTDSGKNNFPDALFGSEKHLLYHGGDMATEEISEWAKAQKQRASLSHVRGRVSIRGLNVKPSNTIEIQKVADRFNGKHLVTGVMHQLYDGTWRADIQFGLSHETFANSNESISLPDASGLVSSISGLHIGVVTKIGGDPQSGNQRIKVRIPYIGANEEGIWARLATLTAGKNRGFAFRPELNDEVILGFINSDPNDAIILGSLHSSKNEAPIASSDDNYQKVFFAKEGMQMVFDDQKKSIQLSTKQGFSILLSEDEGKLELKDKNDNSIELSASGIALKSQSNIKIEATGNVEIKGTVIKLN